MPMTIKANKTVQTVIHLSEVKESDATTTDNFIRTAKIYIQNGDFERCDFTLSNHSNYSKRDWEFLSRVSSFINGNTRFRSGVIDEDEFDELVSSIGNSLYKSKNQLSKKQESSFNSVVEFWRDSLFGELEEEEDEEIGD